ncbi:cold shock domain-containing protein [Beggiatoa leptomitoformis]|uniref:CSD domain-containing protein n=1 Tax=Beggiatoa leptomitoformis TaxID=288004 RepID=A0A2N9YIW6_9GAMM|nr:cold shock domain-containing protein [Beggiatoa leptomitoformis]ALG67351.1 hypothetical protein AL038_06075 [Beggiatoa leptomitoformis]AUI70444.1 hypothetical protein BLE401_18230 [Beggiatoa leptomitoformis]
MENLVKGKLQRWDDEKGFGFILPEVGSKLVFMHVSAMKNSSRRPKVGDIVSYELFTTRDGKLRAINARIEGVTLKNRSKSSWKKTFLMLLKTAIYIGLAVIFVKMLLNNFDHRKQEAIAIDDMGFQTGAKPKSNNTYSCDGRIHCSQMKSCEEAVFFLRNCPNTQMDGNNDGVPCERQLCGR